MRAALVRPLTRPLYSSPRPPALPPALALGINLSIARVGSAINDKTSPAIAELFGVNGLPYALFAGAIICACSLTCALIVVPLDRRADKKITVRPRLSLPPSSLARVTH